MRGKEKREHSCLFGFLVIIKAVNLLDLKSYLISFVSTLTSSISLIGEEGTKVLINCESELRPRPAAHLVPRRAAR